MTRFRLRQTISVSICLHWLTALLFVAAYATIELRELFPKDSAPREAMKSWHYTAGLTILAVAWLRLLLRSFMAPRVDGPQMPRWQALASKAGHIALYALMIALPLLGWLTLSAEGEPLLFFGFDVPALIAPNDGLAEQFEELHETVGKVGYGLIGLHVLAALIHHYVLRDATLVRMLPARS
jgi:cytochrome b561